MMESVWSIYSHLILSISQWYHFMQVQLAASQTRYQGRKCLYWKILHYRENNSLKYTQGRLATKQQLPWFYKKIIYEQYYFQMMCIFLRSNLMGSLTDFNYWWPQLVFLSSPYGHSSPLDCTAYWSLTVKSRKKKFCKVCIFQSPVQVTVYLYGTAISGSLPRFWFLLVLMPTFPYPKDLNYKREPAY